MLVSERLFGSCFVNSISFSSSSSLLINPLTQFLICIKIRRNFKKFLFVYSFSLVLFFVFVCFFVSVANEEIWQIQICFAHEFRMYLSVRVCVCMIVCKCMFIKNDTKRKHLICFYFCTGRRQSQFVGQSHLPPWLSSLR